MWQIQETSPAKALQVNQVSIGATGPCQLTPSEAKIYRGVLIRAPGELDATANTAVVYVGLSNVSVTRGFGIPPGDCIEMPVEKISDVYGIAASGVQTLQYMGM
jgi:hypothetical protein